MIPHLVAASILLAALSAADAEDHAPRSSPDPDRKGKPVFISEGKIPLQDFLKFLSDYTGLPVILNSGDPTLEGKEIRIVNDIRDANEDVVKTILEMNGVRVYVETLPSQKKVLKVEPIAGPAAPEDLIKSPPIVVVDPAPAPRRPLGPTPPPALGASKEPDIERRLRELEAKVGEILKALSQPRSDRLALPPGSIPVEKLDPRRRERVEALNRQFDERLEALRREHREAIRKLLEEP